MAAFIPYGDQLRRQRRLMQAALGSSSIKHYHPLLELETKPFLRGLLEDPLKFQDHLRRCVIFPWFFFFMSGPVSLWLRDGQVRRWIDVIGLVWTSCPVNRRPLLDACRRVSRLARQSYRL